MILLSASASRAEYVTSGDVSPSDPATWTSSTNGYIGYTADGTLMVNNGSDLLSSYGFLGYNNGTTGDVTITGAGSTWNSSYLYAGYNGAGTLNITDGAGAGNTTGYIGFNSGSIGTVTVEGEGSKWTNSNVLYIGNSGTGTLSVTNGGAVSSGYGCIGYNSGSSGTATVDGTGSTWADNSNLSVGDSGTGILKITNGGTVSDYTGYIGNNSSSTGTVTVDGEGSSWTSRGDLYVGSYGKGILNVTNGGTVSNSNSYIGKSSSSTGTVTVDGEGSKWTNSGILYVGSYGTGTLNITNDATVSVAGTTTVGSKGLINFGTDGGTLTTKTLCSATSQLTGTGTINAYGFFSDESLIFDAAHSTRQSILLNDSLGQNVAFNLDLSGITMTGDLGIGYKTTQGSLVVQDGVDIKSQTGYIGYNSGSSGEASLEGEGTSWTNSGYLYVGYEGTGILNIRDGAAVSDTKAYIGYNSGSTGTVTVDGTGSSWKNSSGLIVGNSGTGVLKVTNGATVSDTYCCIGNNVGPSGTGTVTVDGTGSTWTNSDELLVGYFGKGTLNITNGGKVSNTIGYIGKDSNSLCTVTVDGTGSSWTNSDNLYVGYLGAGMLNITDGGTVSSTDCIIGYDYGFPDATGTVTVDGTGSNWTNSGNLTIGSSCNGTLNITNGGVVSVAGTTSVSSTGTINFGTHGGTLSTGTLSALSSQLTGTGSIITSGLIGYDVDLIFDAAHGPISSAILNDSLNQNISLNLDLSGNTTTGDMGIGYAGRGSMTVRDGVDIKTKTGYIGYNSGSTGTVTVEGEGSSWTNSSDLYTGYNGTGALHILDGATVSNIAGYIGSKAGSTGEVNVDGEGSKWTEKSLYVGNSGTGTLIIANGGSVSSSTGYLGYNSGSTGTVTVEGSDSTWTSSGSIVVGYSGTGTLAITDGATVNNTNGNIGCIGYNYGSTGTVTVDGVGSNWTDSGNLTVGSSGKGTLNITNGGTVSVAGTTSVGSSGTINFGNNGGTLTTGTLWSSLSQLTGTGTINTYGFFGDGNLVFDDASNTNWSILLHETSDQNITINFDMSGTTTTGDLGIGYDGNGSMVVQNGVDIKTTTGYIAYNSGSTGTVTVDGIGSSWTNSDNLYVGNSGTGTLNITNGATVSSALGSISNHSGSTGTVTVDAAGSSWTNSGNLIVSLSGKGTLNVSNGAKVSDNTGYIGYNSGSTGTVVVDGPGSSWANSGNLFVGYYCGVGSLSITNGGAVSDTIGYIGYNSGSPGTVTVDGDGSNWANTGALYVGNSAVGTLNITGGGSVSNTIGYIGYSSASTGTVTVDGEDSSWTNTGDLYVGRSGKGTLNITKGGTVSVSGTTTVASTGTINFGTQGGTLTTGALWAPLTQLTGSGTINTYGYLGDGNLVFDSASPQKWSILLNNSSDQNITLNLDLSGTTRTGDLGIGYTGSGSMTVLDGIDIKTKSGYIGYKSGSTGTVAVNGDGSSWTNSNNIYVGNSGKGTLTITDGAVVNDSVGYIGYSSGSTGTATVDGTGSRWANSSSLYVGNSGTGTLTITNGGSVSNIISYIGYNSGSTGTVTINGEDSSWTNTNDLYVGQSGKGTLNIMNGGAVSVAGATYVAPTGTINFGPDGGTLTTGTLWTSFSQLTGTGTITTYGFIEDGDLTFDSASAVNGSILLNDSSDQNITLKWDLSGNTATGDLGIGYNATGSMVVKEGVGIKTKTGYIGYNPGSTGTVTVDGTGSSWTSNNYLYVGNSGTGTLNITNGGAVSNTYGSYIGYSSGSMGTVTVDGIGSIWNNTNGLYIGSSGTGKLSITNGAAVCSDYSYVGDGTGSSGTVTVDGEGSTWTNSWNLNVGESGTDLLNITNGGTISVGGRTIVGTNGKIDFGMNGGTLNTETLCSSFANLTGTGRINTYGLISDRNLIFDATHSANQTFLLNDSPNQHVTLNLDLSGTTKTGNMGIGYEGSGSMLIRDGVGITTDSSYIGYGSGSTGVVTVDGAGSNWTNNGYLYVGYSSTATGTLNITNNGAVSVAGTTTIGTNGKIDFGTNGGTLTTGSIASSSFSRITGTGKINTYGLISNMNLVFDATHPANQTFLLNDSSDQNVTLNLDLSGTTTTGDLAIGYAGNGSMTLQDGVDIHTGTGYIGYSSGSTGTVTVNGPGTTWTSDYVLSTGYYSNGTLAITNGGSVIDYMGIIGGTFGGFSSGSNGPHGTVTVDGVGSTWTNNSILCIGSSDIGTLSITNGATVTSSTSYIGGNSYGYSFHHYGPTGTVTIDGADSLWTTQNGLYIGNSYYSTGTLNVTNGAAVTSSYGAIGIFSNSTGTVKVDGEGSNWTDSGNLYVGYNGKGTLTISNNGLVSVGGTLSIDYDKNGDGEVDMKTGGMLALAGDADDSLANFMDLVSGTDNIRYWNPYSETWDAITGAKADVNYTLAYESSGALAGYTLLTVLNIVQLPGDANGDNTVDVGDLGILADNYGKTSGVTWGMGDFNDDGMVDVGDLGILAAHYSGSTAELAAFTSNIPEPLTLSLLAFAGLAGVIRRR